MTDAHDRPPQDRLSRAIQLAIPLLTQASQDLPDTPLEEWCAGVDQLLEELEQQEPADGRS